MVLLDANVIAWWALGDPRLGKRTLATLGSSDTEVCVSLLTLFELELKIKAGKLRLPGDIAVFLDRFDVPVYRPHAHELPGLLGVDTGHGDPFDRALIGLAVLKGWDVMTSDEVLIALQGLPVKILDSRK